MANGITATDIIQSLHQFGLFELILPFLLTFVVFFGIIQSVNLFKENRMLQATLSLIIGLFVMVSPAGPALANFFQQFFARMGAILIGSLFLLMTFYMFFLLRGTEKDWENRSGGKHMIWIAGIAVLIAFSSAGGFGLFGLEGGVADTGVSPDTIALIGIIGFVLLLIVGVIASARKKEKKRRKRKEKSKRIREALGLE